MAASQVKTAVAPEMTQRPASSPLPPTWVSLPILVVVGYGALLVTGYALFIPRGSTLQPLPLYVFLGLLLLALQADISDNKSTGRIVYLYITSGFALIYAGSAVFFTAVDFTRNPYMYLLFQGLLLAVFVFDVVDRRRAHPLGLAGGAASGPSHRISGFSFQSFGSDFAALGALFYVVWFLQDTLASQAVLRALHLQRFTADLVPPGHAVVDLNAMFGWSLDPSISHLESLDLLIALTATAVALLLVGIVGVLSIASQQPPSLSASPAAAQQPPSVRAFGQNLIVIIRSALDQVLLSLRLVLGPLVWLIPSFSIAAFARTVTDYLNQSAATPTTDILVLFSPLSKAAREGIPAVLTNLVLGAVAVATVILAVTVVEHSAAVIADTMRVLRLAGRTIALTLAFFIYSLAALNAVLILAPTHYDRAPFQVGTAGLAALVFAVAFAVMSLFAPVMPPSVPPPAAVQRMQ